MNWSWYWGQIPVSKKINKRDYAKVQNSVEFSNTLMNFFSLAVQTFEWHGLPDTCDERMLERSLVLNGQAMIAKVGGGYLSLAAAGGYDINVYGYPTKGWGYGLNGFNRQFSLYVPGADTSKVLLEAPSGYTSAGTPEAVICYDNSEAYPLMAYLMADSRRLADLVRSTDVSVKTLKSPIIVGIDESEQNSVKALMDDYEDNVFAILKARGFSLENIKVWPTQGNPQVIAAIWQQYLNIFARLLAILGINSNPNADKKERLLVDEVNMDNVYVQLNIQKRLAWREKFCEQLNALFGLNVSVSVRGEMLDDGPDDSAGGLQEDPDDGAGGGESD